MKWLNNWLESRRNIPKYTAFVRVAGISIPKYIRRNFRRAAASEISHDDLRAQYLKRQGLKRG